MSSQTNEKKYISLTEWDSNGPNFKVLSCSAILFVFSGCPAGQQAKKPKAVNCTLCAKGSYKPDNSTSFCRECAPGYYIQDVGATACFLCPKGSFCPTRKTTYQSCPSFEAVVIRKMNSSGILRLNTFFLEHLPNIVVKYLLHEKRSVHRYIFHLPTSSS